MSTSPLSIGFGNVVVREKVLSVLVPDSMPIKRLITAAEQSGNLINATMGKKTRSVIVMTGGEVVLSGISSDTIINRLNNQDRVS